MPEIIEVKNMQYIGERTYTVDGEQKNLRTMQLVDLDATQWNSLAERTNTRSFIQAMKRQPVSYAEVKLWVSSLIQDTKKAPAITGAARYA